MQTVLCVAEKPSIASALARFLGRREGAGEEERRGKLPVHHVRGSFLGRPALFRVTSVAGHVYSVDFPPEYNSWEKTDPATLFSAPVVKKGDHGVCKHLERTSLGCEAVILWLDCDREGENICFEVLQNLKLSGKKAVYRARFSALTEKDVERAMANLGKPNENEAKAVDVRQELDLKIGVAFTRFQSQFFNEKYGDLNARLVSYGPCQTPTLGFCVARHDEIQHFVPEPFWRVAPVVDLDGANVDLDWGRQRVFNQQVGVYFKTKCEGKEAEVKSVVRKPKRKTRPTALNTIALMQQCSRLLQISPEQTMSIAESLYIRSYITYPRTESTAYASSFDFKEALRAQSGHEIWGDYARSLLDKGWEAPRAGNDAGDHPPITPLRAATETELGALNYQIFDYICRHFLATISPDCLYDSIKVQWTLGGSEAFTSTTIDVQRDGYTRILTSEAVRTTTLHVSPQVGKRYRVLSLKLEEGHTQPPAYLSESDLIQRMEAEGIGTDASISVHIQNISSRNFVKIGPGRQLIPTRLGITMIHGIARIDKQLCTPTVRAAVEKYLDAVATGLIDHETCLAHVLNIFVDKFYFFQAEIQRMDELFEAAFSTLANTAGAAKPLSRCGNCNKFMKLIHKIPARLYCEFCEETFALPRGGSIKLYQEKKCPLDGFELVLWRSGQGELTKNEIICPYCYNHPPMEGGGPCASCTIPTCPHSVVRRAVMPCLECSEGTLLFDPVSQPKWKMSCTACKYCIFLPEDAKKISLVKDEKCMQCGASILFVDFNKKNVPAQLKDGETTYQACPLCDPVLNAQCRIGHTKQTFGKRQYGKKGGKGGGKKRADAKMSFDRF